MGSICGLMFSTMNSICIIKSYQYEQDDQRLWQLYKYPWNIDDENCFIKMVNNHELNSVPRRTQRIFGIYWNHLNDYFDSLIDRYELAATFNFSSAEFSLNAYVFTFPWNCNKQMDWHFLNNFIW